MIAQQITAAETELRNLQICIDESRLRRQDIDTQTEEAQRIIVAKRRQHEAQLKAAS